MSRAGFESTLNPLIFIKWDVLGLDANKSSLEAITNAFYRQCYNDSFGQAMLLDGIYGLKRIPKYDRLNFIMNVLQTSPSIFVRQKAISIIQKESQKYWVLADLYAYINWWSANKQKYMTNSSPVTN
jgi:hypothetical protein